MNKSRVLRILTILTLLAILAFTIPAVPAQAQVTLMISPLSGPVGQRVDVMATGFTGLTTSPLVSQYVSVYLGTYEFPLTYDPTNNRIVGYFIIPAEMPVGSYNVELKSCPPGAIGPCTMPITLTSFITFTVTEGSVTTTITPASLTINPKQGIPGTQITINGSNFTPQSTVHLYFNNIDTGISRLVGDTGTVSIVYAPSQPDPGTYVIRLDDDSVNVKSASANFQLTPELRAFIGKNNGAVGTNQTVAGAGFKPNSPITIKYDNTEITSAKTNTDATGSFTTAFKIPVSTGGNHIITITDGTNTKTFNFTMETTPPIAPVLLSPVMNTIIDGPIFLDWSDVTDDSMPVTYNLQISPDPSFSTVTLEKKDLKESRYTLSLAEVDKLTPVATATQPTPKDTKYYWTVQTVDAASNKGDWSMPSAFIMPAPKATTTAPASASPTTTQKPGASSGTTTGTSLPGNLPGWSVYALGGLIALLFLFIGILLGRRSSYS